LTQQRKGADQSDTGLQEKTSLGSGAHDLEVFVSVKLMPLCGKLNPTRLGVFHFDGEIQVLCLSFLAWVRS